MSEEIFEETPEEIHSRLTGEKLREMVDAEAAAAEAGTPEDDEDEGGEDEANAVVTAMQEALGIYLGRVSEILGENAEIKPCVFCQGWGFNGLDIQPDKHSHRCEDCGGIGRVYTGSLVPGNEHRPCDGCKGAGFVVDSGAVVQPVTEQVTEPVKILSPAEVEQLAAQARAAQGANAA